MEYLLVGAIVVAGLFLGWRLSDWCVERFCYRANRSEAQLREEKVDHRND